MAFLSGITDDMLRYLGFAFASAVLVGLTPVFVKSGARRGDAPGSAALFMTVFAIFAACLCLLSGQLSAMQHIDARSLLFLLSAAVCDGVYYCSIFYALSGGDVNRVLPMVNLAGVLALISGYFLYNAIPGLWKLCFVVLILLGTILMLSRSQKAKGYAWVWFSLLAMAAAAGRQVLVRTGVENVPQNVQLLVRCGAGAALLWLVTFSTNGFRRMQKMRAENWIFVLVAALCLGLSQLCDYFGARYGDYSALAPVALLSFPVAMLFSRILHKEKLPANAVFGMLLILAGQFALWMDF